MRKLPTFYFSSFVLVFFSLPLANVSIPQCQISRNSESILNAISIGSIFVFIGSLMIFISLKGDKGKKYVPLVFLIFFCTAPTFWSAMSRQSKTEQNYWQFNGVVTGKYISNNHAAKTLIIDGTVYEFFPLKLWEIIKQGDVVKKQACNNNILVNDSEYSLE